MLFQKSEIDKENDLLSMFNYVPESFLDFFPRNTFNCLEIQDFL